MDSGMLELFAIFRTTINVTRAINVGPCIFLGLWSLGLWLKVSLIFIATLYLSRYIYYQTRMSLASCGPVPGTYDPTYT